MGRTNPTYRETIRGVEQQWQPYRRALRCRDQPHFDRLFEYARAHADAAGQLNHRFVELPLLVSVLIEQERRLRALEQAVESSHLSDEQPD